MQADGFLNQKQRHPVAMAVAIAINVAGVTAVMLAKNGYVKPIEGILVGEPIPLPDPPPPHPPEQQNEAPIKRNPVYVPPKPIPNDQEEDSGLTGTGILPPAGGSGSEGGSGGTIIPKSDPTPTPIPVITEPVPLASAARDFQPPYPPQLLRTGVEGKAVVRVLIGADGRVKQVAIISADDPLFADATERQALRRWRFKPATRDGVAIEAWKQLTVRFQITG